MFRPLASPYEYILSLYSLCNHLFNRCLNFRISSMNNHTFGEIFERDAPRRSRPSRSPSQFRPSYNKDLIATRFGNEGDDGDAHPSTFPYFTFLQVAGILDDFLLLIQRVGLTSY